jgi:hypothetical protein
LPLVVTSLVTVMRCLLGRVGQGCTRTWCGCAAR